MYNRSTKQPRIVDRPYPSAIHSGSLRRRYFRPTGEYRPPQKGEFYLSGAVVEAWQAPHNFTASYHIAIEIPSPPEFLVINGFRYWLAGVAEPATDPPGQATSGG